jgi:hypothetical protein
MLARLEKGSLSGNVANIPAVCLAPAENLTGRITQLPCHTHEIRYSRASSFRGCRISFTPVQQGLYRL